MRITTSQLPALQQLVSNHQIAKTAAKIATAQSPPRHLGLQPAEAGVICIPCHCVPPRATSYDNLSKPAPRVDNCCHVSSRATVCHNLSPCAITCRQNMPPPATNRHYLPPSIKFHASPCATALRLLSPSTWHHPRVTVHASSATCHCLLPPAIACHKVSLKGKRPLRPGFCYDAQSQHCQASG